MTFLLSILGRLAWVETTGGLGNTTGLDELCIEPAEVKTAEAAIPILAVPEEVGSEGTGEGEGVATPLDAVSVDVPPDTVLPVAHTRVSIYHSHSLLTHPR